jgi:ribosomal subunit interface protein
MQRLSMKATNNTAMNAVPIHISSHGIELSFALRKFIERKMSRLSRFAGDILSAEVVLREKAGATGLFSVSARLALTGRDVQGNAVDMNFYAAINQLVARLARLSRKRKTRSRNANAAPAHSSSPLERQHWYREIGVGLLIAKSYWDDQ